VRRAQRVATVLAAGCLVALWTANPAGASGGTTGTKGATAPSTSACAGAVATVPAAGAFAPGSLFATAQARHATWLTTLDCTSTGRSHDPARAAAGTTAGKTAIGNQTNNLLSSNWSGYQVNQVANYAQIGWTVPTVRTPVPGYSSIGYYSSTWAGIGGGFNSGNGALIQAGTTQDISAAGVTSYYAWYEVVGGTGDTHGEVRINNLPIHPGDVVGGVGMFTVPNSAAAGVCNFTINVCISATIASSTPGTTAEWIAEAPSSTLGVLPLANFGTITFRNGCWERTFVQGAPCQTISSGGPSAISLQQNVLGAPQVLAVPSAITADGLGFTDTYHPPVRQDPCPRC
jgi:hypothetical protein